MLAAGADKLGLSGWDWINISNGQNSVQLIIAHRIVKSNEIPVTFYS